ncbi:hypothetical protein [Serratia sp. JSRIV004]|uniref:hypothetical protein n=1 Tax=Serratia sp. JSRIV004 TaxID=2831895 RepID=UPI001CBD83F1|nr:hypothetical protein [Serratia sp. JSRIV004]UAN55457.1 hypothetical protein KGP21_17325 [Serratia sp. JSRIV004]UAN57270.1 hypothetical protein KGP21_27350 [Serratia sp. JSRIV004]
MGARQIELLERFIQGVTGKPLSSFKPLEGTGFEANALIWPLGSRFKGKTTDISNTIYQFEYEPLADQAIEDYVFNDDQWTDLPLPVLAVLYERFTQLSMLLSAHEKHGTMTVLPPELGEINKAKFLALFWLHGMTLPFPVNGQALFERGKLFVDPSSGPH